MSEPETPKGDAKAGIADTRVGLLGDGGDWHSFAADFAAFADMTASALGGSWYSPSLVATPAYRQALTEWLRAKFKVIKSTRNLQLSSMLDSGARNPLLIEADAVDPCWRTTLLYQTQSPPFKVALLAWNPAAVSKIHDHPLACFEAHLHGPPLEETHYCHPNHATVSDLHTTSTQHPDNPHRWIVEEVDLVADGSAELGEGDVAFDSGAESLHTLRNNSETDPLFTVHTYIGAYGFGDGSQAQSYVFAPPGAA